MLAWHWIVELLWHPEGAANVLVKVQGAAIVADHGEGLESSIR